MRWNAPAMDVASYERTVVYRYRVQGGSVLRLTPIAVNGRGFVEEWLAAPWVEAEAQTGAGNRARMQTFHAGYEQAEGSSDTYVSMRYGPVTACSTRKEFQVKMDTEASGGREHSDFFRIREIGNGYELMDEGETADARCKGRDLLPVERERVTPAACIAFQTAASMRWRR